MIEKRTLVIGLLFQQYGNGLYMPMWAVGDELMFPRAILHRHLYGNNSLLPQELRSVFGNMGYSISHRDPDAVTEIFYDDSASQTVMAFLIRKAKGKYALVDGLMKAEGDHVINTSLSPVDDVFLDHLPTSSRELFDTAFGKMCDFNREFREANLPRFQAKIIIDKMKRK